MELRLKHYAELVSTMDTARNLIGREPVSGLVVLADMQTAGRGRIEGRTWAGVPGASLLMTLCLKGDYSAAEAIPLRIGLAVHEVLSELGKSSDFGIKWPNDIMGRDGSEAQGSGFPGFRKLGGILCETTGEWLFAGIGLNVGRSAYPPSLASSATSLEEVLAMEGDGGTTDHTDIPALALALGEIVANRLGRQIWQEAYEKVMVGIGQEARFIVGHPERGIMKQGRITGIDECGRLLILGKGGVVEAFCSGEISSLRSQ